MARLVIRVERALSDELRGTADRTRRSQSVARLVARYHGALQMLHPDSASPEFASDFSVELPDATAAAELAECLLRLPGVVAAYVKPDDAPPGG